MYTTEERNRIREALITAAREDGRIVGAALTGSAAAGAEDVWSDIDLALAVGAGADISATITAWTEQMYAEHGARHHTDVISGKTTYRVFLLDSSLQVDIAFAPEAEFGARASTFRLIFGTAAEVPTFKDPDPASLIGTAWLYALHARSSLARGRVWQAEYMISGMRDQVLSLACLRCGVVAVQGRGMDQLPAAVLSSIEGALPRSLEVGELRMAFGVAVDALLTEVRVVDSDLADQLSDPLREMTR